MSPGGHDTPNAGDVRAQVLTIDGRLFGAEFTVKAIIAGSQSTPTTSS